MALAIITRMRKQCVPGALSPPSSTPGNEAMAAQAKDVLGSTTGCCRPFSLSSIFAS